MFLDDSAYYKSSAVSEQKNRSAFEKYRKWEDYENQLARVSKNAKIPKNSALKQGLNKMSISDRNFRKTWYCILLS